MRVDRHIMSQLRETIGGWPRTASQYEREAARFDHAVCWHSSPFADGDSAVADGVIHVPALGVGESPRRCHIHELAEAALLSDQAPPSISQSSRHDIARAIDLTEPRRVRTEELDRRICRLAGKMGDLLYTSGADRALITLRRGRWWIQIGASSELPAS